MKITVSVIKADVGGVGGHTRPSDGLIETVGVRLVLETHVHASTFRAFEANTARDIAHPRLPLDPHGLHVAATRTLINNDCSHEMFRMYTNRSVNKAESG